MGMDKARAIQIRQIAEKALRDAFAGTGIEVTFDRGTFTTTKLTAKIDFAPAENGKSAAQVEFERYAPLFGLTADAFGREFVANSKRFVVSGIKISSRKYPIVVVDTITKKSFRMTSEAVKRGLAI